MKTTQTAIKRYCYAIDITNWSDLQINALYNEEGWLDEVTYSKGLYGLNGAVVQGHNTGKLYKICSRCTNLFRVFH